MEIEKNKTPFYKKYRLTPKQQKIWKGVLSVFGVIIILAAIYGCGYNYGYKNGERSAKKTNASDLLKNIQNPFKSFTGRVEKADSKSLTMTTSKGETKTIKLIDKTRITKKTQTLSKDALVKGAKITVFAQGDNNDITASRVVVR